MALVEEPMSPPAVSSSASATNNSSDSSTPPEASTPAPEVVHKAGVGGVVPTPPHSQRSFKSPSKPKMRRKVSVEDALATSTAVQRLVEYFVVVSSQPRWETTPRLQTPDPKSRKKGGEKKAKDPPKTVEKPIVFETPSQNQRTTTHFDPDNLISPEPLNPPTTKKKPKPLGSRFRFRVLDNDATVEQRPSFSDDDEKKEVDSATNPLEEPASPTPRSEWTRDDDAQSTAPDLEETGQSGSDENIHMPSHKNCNHSFQPLITARFPLMDHADNPLNPMITQFCYPSGDVIVPSRVYELPRVHHFVLTNDKGRKVYGTCLTIMEEYHASEEEPWIRRDNIHSEDSSHDIEVTVSDKDSALYIPKVLCILSTWPYLTAFREYLAQLYRLSSSTNIMKAPIERYVINITQEIPAPPPGAYEVQVSILNSTIRFWAPPAKLPIAYVALPYQTLFDCLDVENILLLWNALIMENKILLVSSQYSVLTVCAEILTSLLFPMRWCHLYVPLLPRFICPMLDAPVPYLCGVVRENWLYAQQFVCRETIIVDLDRNTVATGEMTPPFLTPPIKKWSKLRAAIEQTAGSLFWKTRGLDAEYHKLMNGRRINLRRNLANLQKKGSQTWKEKLHSFDHAFNLAFTPTSANILNDNISDYEQSQWDRVQEAFLRFFVALLKDYRKFAKPPNGNEPGVFRKEDFIASQKPENQPFLAALCETQQFEDYITKRLYSPGEPDVIFFDQSIDAKLNRSRLKLRKVDTPFLQSAKAHKVLKKVQAVEPSTEGLSESRNSEPYVYKVWPEVFDLSLVCAPKPIPRMIAAEFDRQCVLVSRLRLANYKPREEADSIDLVPDEQQDFFAADYDSSPECAAFTVFFFAYSHFIGRDWQEYQKKRKELEAENLARTPLFSPGTTKTPERSSQQHVIDENRELPSNALTTGNHQDLSSANCNDDCYIAVCDDCTKATVGSTLPYTSPFPIMYPDFKKFSLLASAVKRTASKTTEPYVTPNRTASLVDNIADDSLAEYEEARAVASAQLDLGFETLKTMSQLRHFAPDPDAYKSLMGACGRCGDTQRALELIEIMKHDGLVDGEVLSWFVSAFAHNDDAALASRLSPANRDNVKSPHRGSDDAYYKYLEKKLELLECSRELRGSSSCLTGLLSSDDESVFSADSSSSSVASAPVQSTSSFMEWFTPHKKTNKKKRKSKRKRRKSSLQIGMPVSDVVAKQVMLAENLLDFLYPSLSIDTHGDCCPQCSAELKESDIVQGWVPCAFSNFTTACPACKHRFVPRFSVTNLAPDFQGSQGLGTPLYCEYLSPWVLRKELHAVAKGEGGIEELTKPEWRSGNDIHSTIWWNLIVLCRKYRLPYTFLLQGSFLQNRLITATP
ncbi:DENN domain-containing protein 5B [Seminavis robusta]|uniref:DENN domain-containing protein 5B n=1 Tax=Seminavis robusta TaxID=568900 RepID=A0A9N8D7S2_9STRA|nr:DENN domain-containing protein 5B [Seminavis robusta]|eukprot:Sro29_g019160.1 DENN domain-containing protein 5B (1371) ;mRNA; f:89734-94037